MTVQRAARKTARRAAGIVGVPAAASLPIVRPEAPPPPECRGLGAGERRLGLPPEAGDDARSDYPDAPVLQRRVWLLMLLDGAERAGVAPLPTARLHRLAFFANCLAPVYDLPVPNGIVVKDRRGPYYPELQWDVDRLAAQGLVELRGVRHVEGEDGWEFTADYGLTAAGVEVLDRASVSPRTGRARRFLAELGAAFGALGEAGRERADEADATYGDRHAAEGRVIDFAEWNRRNHSADAAQAFSALAPARAHLTQRDALHLYFRYLDRVLAGAA